MKLSIIIPNYNGQKLLRKHLPSVVAAANKSEIIVVDDASTDGSVDYLNTHYPAVKIVKHKTNQRFAAACNSGVKASRGDIIILLNNDVSPNKNFLSPLVSHFSDPGVFSAGCKEIQTINGVKRESGRAKGAFTRGLLIHWRAKNQNRTTTLWTSGGSAAFRKSMWEQLGGMDEMYKPAYWEDIDLSYRAKKRGWKVLFEPASMVHHRHETTNSQEIGPKSMAVAAYKNQLLFVWKNITDTHMIARHLIWLPYHLVITSIKTNGLFLLGMLQALSQINQAMSSRTKEKQKVIYSDGQVLRSS